MTRRKPTNTGSYVEMVGKGDGPRLGALQQLIAQKQAQLQPVADALTDAYQATVALGAGEDFDALCKEDLPTYIVLAGYDAKTNEYVLKFSQIFRDLVDDIRDDHGKPDVAALAEGQSKGIARLWIENRQLFGEVDFTRHQVAPNVIAQHCDEEIIPNTSGHSYVEFRSASLPALLEYANAHILNANYAVDGAKLMAPAKDTGGLTA